MKGAFRFFADLEAVYIFNSPEFVKKCAHFYYGENTLFFDLQQENPLLL